MNRKQNHHKFKSEDLPNVTEHNTSSRKLSEKSETIHFDKSFDTTTLLKTKFVHEDINQQTPPCQTTL